MNEKPGLEPGFFCSTSCWRLDGLRVAPGTEDMPGVPLRAGPAHVVKLGPIGIADTSDQRMAPRNERAEASAQRHQCVCAEGIASSSVQLAEHRRERHVEEFVAEFIGDVQESSFANPRRSASSPACARDPPRARGPRPGP